MTTPVHCINYNHPTMDVCTVLGRPTLNWLAQHRGVILWRMDGIYGLVPHPRIEEAKRVLDLEDKHREYSFFWSICRTVDPGIGESLFTQ